jgi:hypothetical protein
MLSLRFWTTASRTIGRNHNDSQRGAEWIRHRKAGTMLRVLHNLPANVLGVEAIGKVTSDEYEQILVPAIQKKRDAHEKIRFIYVLGDEFEGWSAGAMWQDAKLGIKDARAWEKIAIVSDSDWVEHMVTVFGWMVPGEVRVFELDDFDDAREWASE